MKQILTILSTILLSVTLWAQSPEKMSYQAVVRDADGDLVTEQSVGVKISILYETVDGSPVYTETHSVTTNTNGLLTLEIGAGTVVFGDFSTIAWSDGPYFLKTETDPNGGSNYTISGTSQLLSVPYALHAKTAESISGTIEEVDPVFAESVAAKIKASDTVKWNNKLTAEVDGDITNELQLLTISNDTLFLSDGGYVKLPASVSFNGNFNDLDNIPAGLLDGDDDTQLTEAEVDAFVDNNGYLTSEVDGDVTNEIELPDQTDNAGKFLTTDGSNPGWSTVGGGCTIIVTADSDRTLTTDNQIVFINGAYTVTFPENPADGQKITVCTTTANEAASVDPNGKTIQIYQLSYTTTVTFGDGETNVCDFYYSSVLDTWFGTY